MLIAGHVILQISPQTPPPSPTPLCRLHKMCLTSPREQQGQECQIVLFHMAVFIDAWLGLAPGNHLESVCAPLCVLYVCVVSPLQE